jgi:uncharacterized DUF497 family protein
VKGDRQFDWDPAKRQINLDKHGLDFRRAVEVFNDPRHIVEDTTRPEHGEVRRKAIGRIGQLMVCVIFTDRNGVRRIISARRARRDERERYCQSAETA